MATIYVTVLWGKAFTLAVLSYFRVTGHFWKEVLSAHRLPADTHRKCFCASPA